MQVFHDLFKEIENWRLFIAFISKNRCSCADNMVKRTWPRAQENLQWSLQSSWLPLDRTGSSYRILEGRGWSLKRVENNPRKIEQNQTDIQWQRKVKPKEPREKWSRHLPFKKHQSPICNFAVGLSYVWCPQDIFILFNLEKVNHFSLIKVSSILKIEIKNSHKESLT